MQAEVTGPQQRTAARPGETLERRMDMLRSGSPSE